MRTVEDAGPYIGANLTFAFLRNISAKQEFILKKVMLLPRRILSNKAKSGQKERTPETQTNFGSSPYIKRFR